MPVQTSDEGLVAVQFLSFRQVLISLMNCFLFPYFKRALLWLSQKECQSTCLCKESKGKNEDLHVITGMMMCRARVHVDGGHFFVIFWKGVSFLWQSVSFEPSLLVQIEKHIPSFRWPSESKGHRKKSFTVNSQVPINFKVFFFYLTCNSKPLQIGSTMLICFCSSQSACDNE